MNSRNRYASNPTYGASKRGASKKKPEMQEPAPAPYQPTNNAYAPQGQQAPYNGAYPYAQQGPVSQPQQPQQQVNPYYYQQQQPQGYPQQAPYQQAQQPQQPMYQQQQSYQQQSPADYVVLPNQQDMQYAQAQVNDTWVKVLLLAVLPVLFILTLILKDQAILKWVFTVGAVAGLGGMWFFSNFASSAKTTLSLVYIALLLMTVVTLFASPAGNSNNNTGNENSNSQQVSANGGSLGLIPNSQTGNSNNGTGNTDIGGFVDNGTEATATPSSGPSEAQIQMDNFFYLWGANKLEDALAICAPSWKSSLTKDPKTELFGILGIRLPSEVVFEGITGTDADSSRTITITCMIDKQNNRAPTKYRFQVLMLKENSAWYVAPQSLKTNDQVADEEATATPDLSSQAISEEGKVVYEVPTPTPAPTSSTKLYYNKDGGKKYHIDKECGSVDKKYLPLASFTYGDINTSKFKALIPCTICNAPSRP